MVGYDPDDPVTGHGVGNTADSYSATLDKAALKGARLGILRESMGYAAEPDTDDFKQGQRGVRPAPWPICARPARRSSILSSFRTLRR